MGEGREVNGQQACQNMSPWPPSIFPLHLSGGHSGPVRGVKYAKKRGPGFTWKSKITVSLFLQICCKLWHVIVYRGWNVRDVCMYMSLWGLCPPCCPLWTLLWHMDTSVFPTSTMHKPLNVPFISQFDWLTPLNSAATAVPCSLSQHCSMYCIMLCSHIVTVGPRFWQYFLSHT